MNLEHILGIQVLFLGGITFGYHSCKMDPENVLRVSLLLARFVLCLLTSQALELACSTVYMTIQTRQLPEIRLKEKFKVSLYFLAFSVSLLLYHNHPILTEDFVLLLIASAGVRYLEAKRQYATITYGEGMACSFAEGYLYLVIPSDGAKFFGIDEMMKTYESTHRVTFPVRRFLLVITKSMFCPPNLEAFNKNDENVPKIEACQVTDDDDKSLRDVERDVAGVQNRVYRNTAYKIRRRHDDPRPVHVIAECATPIHTLWKVLQKRAVYKRLALADGEEIQRAFCETLPRIIANSPELRGKCELVYYDDTNPNENIAEVLLAKVRELEPRFEEIDSNLL